MLHSRLEAEGKQRMQKLQLLPKDLFRSLTRVFRPIIPAIFAPRVIQPMRFVL